MVFVVCIPLIWYSQNNGKQNAKKYSLKFQVACHKF